MIYIYPTAAGELQYQHTFPAMISTVITGSGCADHKSAVIDSADRHPISLVGAYLVIRIVILRAPYIHHRHIRKTGITAVKRVEGIQPSWINFFIERGIGIFHITAKPIISRY